MTDRSLFVYIFSEGGRHLYDDGMVVSDLGTVPRVGDCIVAESSRDENNPARKTIYEVLRRYLIDESHVHLLVRSRPGQYEEYDVLGGFNPANLPPRSAE